MPMAHRLSLPACVPLDFLETFVRSPVTAVSRTPASTVGTARAAAWPSHANVSTDSPVSRATIPPASHPVLGRHAATGAHVLVSLTELSVASAQGGSKGPRVLCIRGQRSAPGQWIMECSH